MLIISLIVVSLFILLVFCLTKDTGEHTAHARKTVPRFDAKGHSENAKNVIHASDVVSAN